jgi:hypothetical protein
MNVIFSAATAPAVTPTSRKAAAAPLLSHDRIMPKSPVAPLYPKQALRHVAGLVPVVSDRSSH